MDACIRGEILDESHTTPFSLHSGTTKMYLDLKSLYRWPMMRKDVMEYVEKYLTCHQVKAKHQRPAGLLQPLGDPEWKWEDIIMDIVVGLPRMVRQHNSEVRVRYHVLRYEDLEQQTNFSYEEEPVQILDQKDNVFRNKTIPLVKVLWKNNKDEEATWDSESDMRDQYPKLFK
ncbi:uncharacterized protein LOC133806920 [Humulus lupulus]|uniref:uncharacterized protein LOC133806920 n=1 Tax=Humulus lupulus TaxID=3486 RepID=UPI002B40B885|nr:uncharacterized protein LOC133806920 [Humulus lupulus]